MPIGRVQAVSNDLSSSPDTTGSPTTGLSDTSPACLTPTRPDRHPTLDQYPAKLDQYPARARLDQYPARARLGQYPARARLDPVLS